MGYTTYWYTGDITPEQDLQLISAALKLFTWAEANGIALAYEYDQDDAPPLATTGMIRFNGVGEESYETFMFQAHDSAFCKTARMPYDTIVGAFLVRAKEILGEALMVRSDGLDEWDRKDCPYRSWAEAREAYRAVFGAEAPYPFMDEVNA